MFLWRRKKRNEVLREIAKRMPLVSNASNGSQNEFQSHKSAIKDVWEVPFQSIDIDYKTFIGKGAFSVVHLGFLHGKAPVVNLFPSIAMQKFGNCEVAIKTLPQHCNGSDKTKFITEINLMKEIGYHVHLRYLSSNNFVHRDLAARNVLLNTEMKAMVSDFGLSKKLDANEQIRVHSGGKLPLKWMALESLQEQKFSLKTDVWSFGILLFEIFSLGQEPYKEISNDELKIFLERGKRLSQPNLASNQIYDLMRQCWHAKPSQRPDFSEIQVLFMAMLENVAASYGYLPTTEQEN